MGQLLTSIRNSIQNHHELEERRRFSSDAQEHDRRVIYQISNMGHLREDVVQYNDHHEFQRPILHEEHSRGIVTEHEDGWWSYERRQIKLTNEIVRINHPVLYDRSNMEVNLFRESMDYQHIYRLTESKAFNYQITSIKVINDPYLWACYNITKSQYKNKLGEDNFQEELLVHATSLRALESILKDNLSWRKVRRGRFGIGVSFSPDADYANDYCNNNAGNQRVFIVARVLIGNCSLGEPNLQYPKPMIHTGVDADTSVDYNGKVFVKYRDHEFYPQYLVFYTLN